jgi:two-component system, OmpR family, response regulator QseB
MNPSRSPMRLLLLEDSDVLRPALQHGLVDSGYAVDVAENASAALRSLELHAYSTVIVDLDLPELDRRALLKMLGGRARLARLLVAVDSGEMPPGTESHLGTGVEYLARPLVLADILAHLSLLPACPPKLPESEIRVGKLRLDPNRRAVCIKDHALALSPKEFTLLECLVRQRGRLMTRMALFEHIYSGHRESSDKVIEVLMSTLRTKLSRAGAAELIETRRGMGYIIPTN